MDSRDLILRFIFDDFSLVAKNKDFHYELQIKVMRNFPLNEYPSKLARSSFVIKGRRYIFPAPFYCRL